MTDTAVATRESALSKFTDEELDLIKQTVAKDATDEELSLFLYTAKARGLNPLTRQIHFVKRGGQGTIQTGIDGFRLIAQRTKTYAPGSKPTIFEYDSKGNLLRATVFGIKLMNGQAFEFSATAKFSEYAQYFNGQLGNMWKKMPETMLEKCSEAKMLRRGFPEELSGLYADEEMMQADVQADGEMPVHHAALPTPTHVIEVKEESVEANPDNPYSIYLERCPEHGDDWRLNKFGKHSHIMPDKRWCNFSEQIKPILKRNAEKVSMSNIDVNEWCKQGYEGKTWSKLSDDEQVEALYKLDQLAEKLAEKQVDPIVAEAVKMGAKVVD